MTEHRAEKPEARMEDWHLICSNMPSFHLIGVVFGHGRFLDGGIIVTSDLVDIRAHAAGGIRAETLNTIYHLGRPWVGELPDAYRMLARDMLGDDWRLVLIEDLQAG